MPRRRIHDDEPTVHSLTFSTYRRRNLFAHARPCHIVLGQLGKRLGDRDGRCLAVVVMPDHVHALIWFSGPGRLAEFMRVWKHETSTEITRDFAAHVPGYRARIADTTIWQARYYDFNVLTAAKAREKLDTIHASPVRAGLCERPCDYPWSSARWYDSGRPIGLNISWPPGFD